MTQNLDLDLSTSKALTPSDSDVAANWTPGYATATSATSSTILASDTGQRSWNLGDYRIINPTTASSCGSGKNSAANCSSQFTAYATPVVANGDENAHYILGNHYQWNAATAGTGGTISSGQAAGSICPKGWRLPTSGASGEFQALVSAGNLGTSVANLNRAPYYFVRGGSVDQGSNLFIYAGMNGTYWSSTPVSGSASNSYNLYFDANHFVVSATDARQGGRSVRCVAR